MVRGFGQGSATSRLLPFIDVFPGRRGAPPLKAESAVAVVVLSSVAGLRKSAPRSVYREPASRVLSPAPRELVYPRDAHSPRSNSRAIVYLFADLIVKKRRAAREGMPAVPTLLLVALPFASPRLTMTWNVGAYFLPYDIRRTVANVY